MVMKRTGVSFRKGQGLALLLFLVLFAVVLPVSAWNSEGHMAVAYVAYQRLTPATRDRVDVLLKLNPYHSKWLAMVPPGTSQAVTERIIFMLAATWPDEIKSDPQYHNDGPNNGDTPPAASTSSQNIGYADHLRHKYWHFVDNPFATDGTPLPQIPTPNAQTEIATFRAVLGSTDADTLKSYDLVWLEHLVGDVHQPLHTATRVSTTMPTGDAGGNLVMLCSAPCRNELHAFWDGLIGTRNRASVAVTAARKLPSPDDNLADQMNEAAWVQESFEEAQTQVYVSPIESGRGPFMITPAYRTAARNLARQRVALAGARLANLLNNELK